MEGLNKMYFQYFPVYGESDMKKVKIDGYKDFIYDPSKILIKYKFDLSNCVRLDLLLKSAVSIHIKIRNSLK